MTTSEIKATETICFEIFKRMVDSLENRISSQSFKNEVKYHSEQINKSFESDFREITNILQTIVDKFYLDYYEISGFQYFTFEDFESCVKHNLGLLRNCKKLIKFAA